MNRRCVGVTLLVAIAIVPAQAAQRLPTIPPAQYSDAQKQAAAEFEAARRVPLFGPFEPMMHSPQMMSQARAMGDYLRYHSAIGNTLSELAILVVAHEWQQDYEWGLHYPIALRAGIQKPLADDIAAGRRPGAMSADEAIVFDFTTELLRTRQVSDATFERARSRFGADGVVDMTGIAGYYSLLAMQLNVAQYRAAAGMQNSPAPARPAPQAAPAKH
jgi:4-carboxymuconolactone decarboxylase